MVDPASTTSTAYRLYRNTWLALDWVFPPRCGGCDERGSRWCKACQEQVVRLPAEICPVCGRMMRTTGQICRHCREVPPDYHQLRSFAIFDGSLRKALHRLKYARDIALADNLTQPLPAFLRELGWEIDLIVPVPLSKKRLKERGYNQAALLALPLALAAGFAYRSDALVKIKETRTQVGLNIQERRLNVSGAFCASQELVKGKRVLLFDDVTTSGATIESCAGAIMGAGADQVFGMTLARAAFAA